MSGDKNSPSAPPEESGTGGSSNPSVSPITTPPYPIENVNEMHRGAPAPASVAPTPYSEPPPSYQDALTYPTSSYQNSGIGMPMPKPDGGEIPPYHPLPPVSQQYPPLNAVNPQNAPVVVTLQSATVGNCSYCRVGTIMTETDLCCLICLVVLAIFTFPFGLLFLCCIPCTAHRRCSNCRRIA